MITIGAYNASVECRIEGGFDALRLTCTSPEGGGILIDDFSVEALRPMRIVSVTTEQPVLPVLVGNAINPVVRVRVVTDGSLEPIAITGIRWTLASGQQRRDIATAAAYAGRTDALEWRKPDECFEVDAMLGASVSPARSIETTGSVDLVRGHNLV